PAAAVHALQNIHGGLFIGHHAVGGLQFLVQAVVTDGALLVFGGHGLIIAGLQHKVGHDLVAAGPFPLADVGVLIVVYHLQRALAAVVIGGIHGAVVGPFQDGALAAGIRHHVMVGGVGGVV